jgi:hypothetical protein
MEAGEAGWSGEADWEQLDRAAAAIRARTAEDLARAEVAETLTFVAKYLGDLAHGVNALDVLDRNSYRHRPGAAREALARAAGVGKDELAEHLRSTGLDIQAELFTAAARLLTDGPSPASPHSPA